MTNPMLQKVSEIESWFKPNPHVKRDKFDAVFDPVFDLVHVQEPDQLVIEIRQFIFTRGRILIPHEGNSAWLTVMGKEHMAGGDLQSLRNALVHHSLIKTAPEKLAQLFSTARKPKPNRKGASLSRKKRRA